MQWTLRQSLPTTSSGHPTRLAGINSTAYGAIAPGRAGREPWTLYSTTFLIKSLQVQHVPKAAPKLSMILDALTSILMKTFEKLVRSEISRKTEHVLDPMQFAYRPYRGVEDATVTLINLLFNHLEGNGSHARLIFVDFSSTFNTIQSHILIRFLEQFDLSKNLVGWIFDFLTIRTQRVRVNEILSVCSSTGSPQGRLLLPV